MPATRGRAARSRWSRRRPHPTPARHQRLLPARAAPAPASAPASFQLQGSVPTSGTVINLLQLETLPQLPEQKIQEAIRAIGGQDVTIRRVLRGNVRDDARDTLVLEGRVPNQIALVRVLTVAARLFAGQTITADDIRVLADEGGALSDQAQTQTVQTQLGGGATSSLFGGARGARLTNEVRTNLGRAKAVEAANGQILSFIEVTDLPQVRVDIRLWEVNRTKLRTLNPNAALLLSDFRQPSLNPAQSATTVQGDQAARVGTAGAAIQNVLSFLNGGLLNELQYSGGHLADRCRVVAARARGDRADAVVAIAHRVVGRAGAGAGGRRSPGPDRVRAGVRHRRHHGRSRRRNSRASSAPSNSFLSACSCRFGRSSEMTARSRSTSSRSW